MQFKRSDLPGLAMATLAGPAIMLLFLASYEVWDHQGTPLLSAFATNVGITVGVAAIFSRFIRDWDAPLTLLSVLVAVVVGVIWMQQSGRGDGALITTIKWIGVVDFLLLNVVILYQVAKYGLLPILDRRDWKRAAEQAEQ